VRGQAHRVTHPAELWRMREDAVVWPWAGGTREVYIRIVPVKVTGRRPPPAPLAPIATVPRDQGPVSS
jgi:hypothetical protein